ncbi:hypothetical protein GWI33_021453 [Rhynchophorus ferrugineus]|uniref:Uncharacterized protein n=1 Tax=Rhynchophorus ferrugineus TaxID=354439 RepID=A0A834J175_RHYFE|nr:hypothetical protein GWI33_021453 [Rhynchophorus ferrugineus]
MNNRATLQSQEAGPKQRTGARDGDGQTLLLLLLFSSWIEVRYDADATATGRYVYRQIPRARSALSRLSREISWKTLSRIKKKFLTPQISRVD